ncbi:hypothetical protein, partial [Halomonas getboli]|uniref:hypothetical protein n=1 Tax=Halomonas getboli TaxID=2935862 RepID=UPI001FFFC74B
MPHRRLHHTLLALLTAATLASPLALAHGGHGAGQGGAADGPGRYAPCTGPGMMNGYGQGMGPGMMN